MIRLYTIGFTNKTAEEFFHLIESSGVRKIIDTRISNSSQLSGFAKGQDLAYFSKRVCNTEYEHILDFAPTKELLDKYRKKELTWDEYEQQYLKLLHERSIDQKVNVQELDQCCLLCSEHSFEKCHRRLLAEYLQSLDGNIEIVHLK